MNQAVHDRDFIMCDYFEDILRNGLQALRVKAGGTVENRKLSKMDLARPQRMKESCCTVETSEFILGKPTLRQPFIRSHVIETSQTPLDSYN
jgi:hypothetical protein